MAVTVKDLDDLMAHILKLREEKEVIEASLKEKNKEINTNVYKAAAYLEELGRTEYHTSLGKFVISPEERVNLPETDLDKQKLFAHLRERGIFDRYATVNSNSLNALFFADRAAFVEQGGDPLLFQMPGIGPVKFQHKPDFKPARKKKAKDADE